MPLFSMHHSHQKDLLCARIRKMADQTDPTGEASTTDYDLNETKNCLERDRFIPSPQLLPV